MEWNNTNGLWNQILTVESFAAVIVDSSARIMTCNKGFLQMFAILHEEYMEKSLYDIINSEGLKSNLMRLLVGNLTRDEFIISYFNFSGNVGWNRVEASRLEENGNYFLIFHDLTEAYQAQMIMEAHSMVSDDIFLFFDQRDYVLQCSEKAARVFGFSSGREAMGVHYTTLMYGKVNLSEVEKVFIKLHQQEGEGYLGYISLQQEHNSFYEISGFHVNLRAVSVGYVLLLKLLGEDFYISPNSLEEKDIIKENSNLDSGYVKYNTVHADTSYLYWNSKECKEGLQNLKKAIEHYEYIEINELLEQIIVLAPEKPYAVLQNIQKAIMNLEYDTALNLYNEAHFILKE